MVEVLGVVATLFILLSFFFSSEATIRKVNLVGAVLFVVYGVLISAFSVYLLNGALIITHVYKLIKMRMKNKERQGAEEQS